MGYLISILLFVFIGIPLIILGAKQDEEKREKEREQMEVLEKELSKYAKYEYVRCDYKYELVLKSRSKALAPAFQIRNMEHVTFTYQPASYIYTSATVGGITTGGIEKVGGRTSVVRRKATEKCEILYCGHEIEYVRLTDELYKKAKKSKISQYIDKDEPRIIIRDINKMMPAVVLGEVVGSDNPTTLNIYEDLKVEASRTYEECNEIIDWICEND